MVAFNLLTGLSTDLAASWFNRPFGCRTFPVDLFKAVGMASKMKRAMSLFEVLPSEQPLCEGGHQEKGHHDSEEDELIFAMARCNLTTRAFGSMLGEAGKMTRVHGVDGIQVVMALKL